MFEDVRRFLAQSGVLALAGAVALALVFVRLVEGAILLLIYVVAEAVSDRDRDLGYPVFEGRRYDDALAAASAFLVIAGVLFLAYRRSESRLTTCPACLGRIPEAASVCRWCGSDVRG